MIKLGKLRVNNFKSFKDDFTINLGSTDLFILDGPNGFGKTTLFDAIELCFTGKIGRVSNTDKKQKNNHLLKYNDKKSASVFLELLEDDNTKVVIYAHIPPSTSKEENKPDKCSVATRLLKSWPSDFEREDEFLILNDDSLERIVDNKELKNTYDIFNYIQQEETCHFLKNTESERHNKISYLFGTKRHNAEKEKLKAIRNKLVNKITSIGEEFNKLDLERINLELSIQNEIGYKDSDEVVKPSGKLDVINTFQPQNLEQVNIHRGLIEKIYWIANNKHVFSSMEFNHYINFMCDNRKQEIQDVLLVGHFSNYEEIEKISSHINWLSTLSNKLEYYMELKNLKPDASDKISLEILDGFTKAFPILALRYNVILNRFESISKEINGQQKTLESLLNHRDELKNKFTLLKSPEHNHEEVKCPFCGDFKSSLDVLMLEYDQQSIIFESLKSDSLKLLGEVAEEIFANFIPNCISKIERFEFKYSKYSKLLNSYSEMKISRERWNKMKVLKDWLIENNIDISTVTKKNNDVFIGGNLTIKNNEFIDLIKGYIIENPVDKDYSDLKNAMKTYSLSMLSGEIINKSNDIVRLEDIKIDSEFVHLLGIKFNSSRLQQISLLLNKLTKNKEHLDNVYKIVNSVFNKYNGCIKEFEKTVAKQISIPFYIYSSKVLQTRPDGNGAYLQSAENIKDNAYLRFVSKINDDHDAWNTMSSGQLSGLVISFMLSMNKVYPTKLSTLLIDDPVQTMDEINLASFVQLLRNEFSGYQIIMSTHERRNSNFFAYKFQNKTVPRIENMKEIRLGMV